MSEADPPDKDPARGDTRADGESRAEATLKWWGIGRRLRAMLVALIGPDGQLYEQPAKYQSDKQADEAFAKRRQGLIDQRAGLRLWRIVLFAAVSTLPFGVLIYAWLDGNGFDELGRSVFLLGFLEGLWLISTLVVRTMVRALSLQIDALEYERSVRDFVKSDERTAADLFFRHQNEVKSYYDQILRQNSQVFWLGIVCVLVGLAIVGGLAVSMLFAKQPKQLSVQIVSGGLGVVAAGLTGAVARVYLTVHDNSAKSIGRFHERLVATNHYHLANLIITRIDDRDARQAATVDLAHAVASPNSFEDEHCEGREAEKL